MLTDLIFEALIQLIQRSEGAEAATVSTDVGFLSEQFCKSDLKLFVLRGVDDRVDTTVCEDGDYRKVVEISVEIDRPSEEILAVIDRIARPAKDEAGADDDEGFENISRRFTLQ